MVFIDGKVLRLAVHRGAGAEDDLLDIELHHDLHQVDAPRDVVLVVLQGEGTRLSHTLQSGEVNDAGDLAGGVTVPAKHLSDLFFVSQISIVKRNVSPSQLLQLADHI